MSLLAAEGIGREGPTASLGSKVAPLPLEGYRGTSLVGKRTPLGPYLRTMPRVLGGF